MSDGEYRFTVPQMPPVQQCRKMFIELEVTTFDKVTLSLAGIDAVLLSHDSIYFYLKITKGDVTQKLQFFESTKVMAAYEKLKGALDV